MASSWQGILTYIILYETHQTTKIKIQRLIHSLISYLKQD